MSHRTLHVQMMSTERNFIGAVWRAVRTSIGSWVSLLTIRNQLVRYCMQSASVFTDFLIVRSKETLRQIFVGTPILTSFNTVYNWSTRSLQDDVALDIWKFQNFSNNLTDADNDRIDYVNIITNPRAALTVNRTIKVVIVTTLMTEVKGWQDSDIDFTDGVYTDRTSFVNNYSLLNCLIKL